MSFSYQLQKINQSFDQIAAWYGEFMRKTELCFRKLHERVLLLEQRPSSIQAPTDEQLERVLRRILAERFSDQDMHHVEKDEVMRDEGWVLEDPYPKSVKMNVSNLLISPDAIPSQAYAETFQMLDETLDDYPGEDLLPGENESHREYPNKKDPRSSSTV